MIKRYYILIGLVMILLLCTSCEDKITLPAPQPDGTFTWHGFELIREDLGYRTYFPQITVPENVITTNDRTLTLFLKSGGSDPYEYGTNEFIQVNLDGIWYTITNEISHREDPLILKAADDDEAETKYTVDFSSIGELPAGKYRLVENFYLRRLQDESFNFAYFWVIKPNGKRPSESETAGKARKEDIVLTAVTSPYEARRDITDRDTWFRIFVENISGKTYYVDHTTPILEINRSGKWEMIEYRHINAGLMRGWETHSFDVFFKEFPQPGHYRIRIPIYTDDRSETEMKCEFSIISYEDTSEPEWEMSRLTLSRYDASESSTGIIMSVANPVLNENNTVLDITLTTDKLYNYGEYYETEVLLDGKWYRVPYAGVGFNDIEYTVDATDNEYSRRNFSCDPLNACGIVPAGQYRIIKEFTIPDPDSSEEQYTAFAREFVIAEFTVEELFEREPVFIG